MSGMPWWLWMMAGAALAVVLLALELALTGKRIQRQGARSFERKYERERERWYPAAGVPVTDKEEANDE